MKSKINLGPLQLDKKTIAKLDRGQMDKIMGGNTTKTDTTTDPLIDDQDPGLTVYDLKCKRTSVCNPRPLNIFDE